MPDDYREGPPTHTLAPCITSRRIFERALFCPIQYVGVRDAASCIRRGTIASGSRVTGFSADGHVGRTLPGEPRVLLLSSSSSLPLWRNPCCQPPPRRSLLPFSYFFSHSCALSFSFYPPCRPLQPAFQSYFPLTEMLSLFLFEPLVLPLIMMVPARRHFVPSTRIPRWIMCFSACRYLHAFTRNAGCFFTARDAFESLLFFLL